MRMRILPAIISRLFYDKEENMNTFSKLLSYARERKAFMVLALVLSAVATVLSFVPYYFFWQILREITGAHDPSKIREFSFLIFGTTLLQILTYFLALLCSHVFAFRLETNMRKRGLNSLLRGSFSFFDLNPSGRTRKIIDDNASNTHTIVAHILPDSVNALLFPICLLILSFMVDVYIGVLIVIAVVVSMICFRFMSVGSEMMTEYMKALEDINSETVEYVRGIQVIKVFGMFLESFEKLHRAIMNYSKIINQQCQAFKIGYVLFQTVMMSFGVLILTVAYPKIESGSSTGEIITLVVFFISFFPLLYNAIMKIMFFNKNLGFAKDALGKLEGIMAEMEKNKLRHGSVDKMENYDIEFDRVAFEYAEGVAVLDDFSLKLDGGKKYAVVGSSGSGKSTIAKLISGFYPISKGSLKIGGREIAEYSGRTLEQNIAFVFQNAKLFKKSIYENVRIGRPDSTREEVMRALKLAMCDSIIEKFETRENTLIGAEGVHLSGGEIQRIAIARAILKDAPIVILDEASAASDPENEYEMQQAFSSLMKNKTVIMIAHRLSSIRNADEILVMDEGRVIERGNHETLMEGETKYRHFQEMFAHANDWRMNNEK